MVKLRTNRPFEISLPFPWNESPRGITVIVLGNEYAVEYDKEENVPSDESELEILKLQLEMKIANGELGSFMQRYFPEDGYTVFQGLDKMIKSTMEHLSQDELYQTEQRSNSFAIQEIDRHCIYQLRINAARRGVSGEENGKVF